MNPQEISFDRYNSLQREISKHNEIQSALKEAYELIKWVVIEKENNKNNPDKFKQLEELQKKFVKEYIDLENSIKKSVKDDKNISIEERRKIMFELSDIVDLAEKNDIKEHKNLWSRIWDVKRSIWGNGDTKVDTTKVKAEAEKLNEKKELITKYFKKEKFSETELKKLLTISNEERKKLWVYSSWNDAWKIASLFGIDSRSADAFLNQEEVIRTNQFQDDIIKRIWLEKWYNESWDIHAFHPSLWNYITNAPIVENALKTNDVQNLWNKALKNYLSYLESKWELSPKILKSKFWEKKSNEIFDFIKRNTPDKSTWEKFSDDFVNKITKIVDDALNFLKEKINWLFNKLNKSKNIDEFKNNLEEIKTYDKDEQQMLIERFKIEIEKKESNLRKLFIEPIKTKLIKNGKTEKDATIEAENKTNEILIKIDSNLSPEKLGNAYKIIEDFNKEYDTKLSPKKAVSNVKEVSQLKSDNQALKFTILAETARKNWDEEKAKQYEKNAHTSMIRSKVLTTTWKLIDQTSEQEAKDIWAWKLDYEKHLEKIYERDPSLKKEIDELNKEKKEFEDQNKKTEDTNKISKTETESKQTNIETSNYTYDENSWVIEIALDNWNQKLELSPTERELAKNNPKTIEKIVDFYLTLKDLWLSELWKEKEKIFTSISNKYWIGFNSKSGYLSENGTKVFLNSILKSVSQEKIDNTKSLTEFKNIFSNKNDLQIIWSWYKDNLLQKWSSKISEQFLQKYVIWKPYFDIDWFSKKI